MDFVNILKDKDLKVTPQRMAVLDAVFSLKNHPDAESILEYIGVTYPHISTATVYKILDTYVANNILAKVKTENDRMRYDPILQNHHHIYCIGSERIEDYFDEELDNLIAEHFQRKNIKNFQIKNIKLQISGEFIK